jgi:hypothetical protein
MDVNGTVYYWQELFKYIKSVLIEYERRRDFECELTQESLMFKVDHCFKSVTRLLDYIAESYDHSDDDAYDESYEITYLTQKLCCLLDNFDEHRKICANNLLMLKCQQSVLINNSLNVTLVKTFTGSVKIMIDIEAVSFLSSIRMKWEDIAQI